MKRTQLNLLPNLPITHVTLNIIGSPIGKCVKKFSEMTLTVYTVVFDQIDGLAKQKKVTLFGTQVNDRD